MNILLSGSLAYDYIMDFPDSFKNHILPDQIHILNVSFIVDKLHKNLGGTAGNIAYTMKLLGSNPLILAPLGKDADEYLEFLQSKGIETKYITKSKEKFTASAHITTDKDDNQITAFYPGALGEVEGLDVKNIDEKISVALISPTYKEAMIKHAKECDEKNIPFCFDPGQQITAFTPQELMMLIGQAKILIGNDYEMKLMEQKTGWDKKEIFDHVEVMITTLGEKGSLIADEDGELEIEPCKPLSVSDPTGAGDAYRAGFFTAYAAGHKVRTCGRIGSVAASYAIEHYGTQNHKFTMKEFAEKYEKTYGEKLPLLS